MLFPDYKNTTSVTLTTNTNPSHTVTQDCMVYTRLTGSLDNDATIANLFIDDINLTENAVSSDFGDAMLYLHGAITIFIKEGSTVSVKVTKGLPTNRISVTLKLIPLTNMGGGGVTTYSRLRHEQQRISVSRNRNRLLHNGQYGYRDRRVSGLATDYASTGSRLGKNQNSALPRIYAYSAFPRNVYAQNKTWHVHARRGRLLLRRIGRLSHCSNVGLCRGLYNLRNELAVNSMLKEVA